MADEHANRNFFIGLIAVIALISIPTGIVIGAAWLGNKPGRLADDYRECVTATHNEMLCNRLVYPEKVERWKMWKQGKRP